MTFSASHLTTHDAPLLGINIDHVATVRNARGGRFPDPVMAAQWAIEGGADIVTFHLREDRRHIQDEDVARLKSSIAVPLNFEAAVTDEMLGIIERIRPDHVCLVPERRQEVTTEGGLDVVGQLPRMKDACGRLAAVGARVSLFIDADSSQIEAAAQAGAPCVELHTGALSNAWWAGDAPAMQAELIRLQAGLTLARSLGLRTHAGHGLALAESWVSAQGVLQPVTSSTAMVAAFPDIRELHIGHALIGQAIFVGIKQAISDFKAEVVRAHKAALA